MPSRSATTFAAGGGERGDRVLRGASGRVSSAATSCCPARRSSTSAPNGAVAATAIRATGALAEDETRSKQAERLAARLGVGAVEHQLPVEVVDLVLDDARRMSLELERDRRALGVERLDRHARVPLDRDADRAERETALELGLGLLSARA